MIYATANDWLSAAQKRVVLFGMSGLGKTHLSNVLRDTGDWFHYSVDYRIGTRYMGEHITDNAKREAMKVPFLRDLLMTDSIYIASNITFNNLAPLSSYLGKPGNPELGGLEFVEYQKRQAQHHQAEVSALLDTPHFIDRAKKIYGYDHFVCDTGGSICEVVDPQNPGDKVLKALSDAALLVWIKASDEHTQELIRRFDRAPKPMCYQPDFLLECWTEYLRVKDVKEHAVDPDDFIRWTYARALGHRQSRYAAMADWGLTVQAKDVAVVKTGDDFTQLIASELDALN